MNIGVCAGRGLDDIYNNINKNLPTGMELIPISQLENDLARIDLFDASLNRLVLVCNYFSAFEMREVEENFKLLSTYKNKFRSMELYLIDKGKFNKLYIEYFGNFPDCKYIRVNEFRLKEVQSSVYGEVYKEKIIETKPKVNTYDFKEKLSKDKFMKSNEDVPNLRKIESITLPKVEEISETVEDKGGSFVNKLFNRFNRDNKDSKGKKSKTNKSGNLNEYYKEEQDSITSTEDSGKLGEDLSVETFEPCEEPSGNIEGVIADTYYTAENITDETNEVLAEANRLEHLDSNVSIEAFSNSKDSSEDSKRFSERYNELKAFIETEEGENFFTQKVNEVCDEVAREFKEKLIQNSSSEDMSEVDIGLTLKNSRDSEYKLPLFNDIFNYDSDNLEAKKNITLTEYVTIEEDIENVEDIEDVENIVVRKEPEENEFEKEIVRKNKKPVSIRKREREHQNDILSKKIILVTGEGGLGKTTISKILAEQCARKNQEVLLVDLDVEKRTLSNCFKDLSSINYQVTRDGCSQVLGLAYACDDVSKLIGCVYEICEGYSYLGIRNGISREAEEIVSELYDEYGLDELMHYLRDCDEYHTIIYDCPLSTLKKNPAILTLVGKVIWVGNASYYSAMTTVDFIESYDLGNSKINSIFRKKLRLLVNQCNEKDFKTWRNYLGGTDLSNMADDAVIFKEIDNYDKRFWEEVSNLKGDTASKLYNDLFRRE